MDQSVIAPSMIAMMDASPEHWYCCKDQNSVYLYANSPYLASTGYLKPEDILGDTDYDLPCAASECAALFQKQDQETLKTGRVLQLLDIHPYTNAEWRVISAHKKPLLDAQGQPTGALLVHGVDITSRKTLELGSLLSAVALHDPVVTDAITGSNSYVIGQHLDDVALTESESEILFFLLRLPSLKGLSRVLNVSMHVVEREVESLMYKFGATSKRELLDVATQQGYLNQIPATLFNQQLSVILREQG